MAAAVINGTLHTKPFSAGANSIGSTFAVPNVSTPIAYIIPATNDVIRLVNITACLKSKSSAGTAALSLYLQDGMLVGCAPLSMRCTARALHNVPSLCIDGHNLEPALPCMVCLICRLLGCTTLEVGKLGGKAVVHGFFVCNSILRGFSVEARCREDSLLTSYELYPSQSPAQAETIASAGYTQVGPAVSWRSHLQFGAQRPRNTSWLTGSASRIRRNTVRCHPAERPVGLVPNLSCYSNLVLWVQSCRGALPVLIFSMLVPCVAMFGCPLPFTNETSNRFICVSLASALVTNNVANKPLAYLQPL